MRLFSFNSLANKVGDGTDLPSRIKIFNWGVNKTLKGDVIVNDKTAKVLTANQKAIGRDTIVLDFEHNTVPKTPEYERTKEPRPVAGHCVAEVVMGDGVYLSMTDWTAYGQSDAKNFKDLSPAPYVDDDGVLIGLHSVALTQTGAVFDLTFLNSIGTTVETDLVTMSAAMGIETPDAYKLALQNKPPVSKNMNEQIKIFRAALSMGDDKTDEEVLKCMSEAIKEGKWVKSGPLDDAGGTTNKIHVYSAQFKELLDAELKPLKASLETMSATAVAAQKAAEETERNGLIAQASREGKEIRLSAEDLKLVPVGVLRNMITLTPKTVPMDRSPMAIIKNGETGKIKGGPARQVSMTVQGVPITLNIDGAAPAEPKLSGLARASAALQKQYENTQSN